MTKPSETSEWVWLCPQCGRRVPKRASHCHCGFEQRAPAPVATGTPPAPRSGKGATLLRSPALSWGFAGLLLVIVGILYFSQSRDSREPSPVAKEVAGPENTASETEATTTAEPTPRHWYPAVLPPASSERSLEDVIAQVLPAVVSVESERGRGSGFFAAPGIVITNYHVVYGSRRVLVKVKGVNPFTAEVESVSEETDLALLRVEAGASTPLVLELGSANDVRPGQEVVAVGSALGLLESTVTRGIVSAVRTEGPLTLLQTDAAINPGESGGPLINRRGEVIGITTLKLKPAESIGFAVAADHARSLLAGGGVRLPELDSGRSNLARAKSARRGGIYPGAPCGRSERHRRWSGNLALPDRA